MPDPSRPAQAGDPKRIINNIVALGGSELVARIIAFIGTAYVARVLGPEAFGIIGFAAAIVGYLSMGITAGLNEVGSLEVGRGNGLVPLRAIPVPCVPVPLYP